MFGLTGTACVDDVSLSDLTVVGQVRVGTQQNVGVTITQKSGQVISRKVSRQVFVVAAWATVYHPEPIPGFTEA